MKIKKLLLAALASLPILAQSQVTDVDGNVYQTVLIGNQEWMAENLRTSRLNDGTPIDLITGNTAWTSHRGPAMCWYNNDSATHDVPYGRMYNGEAAQHPNLCPTGWSVPTTLEWDQMITHLGGASVAGGKLKHADTTYWESPNLGATNSSGFTAMPSGFRSHMDGSFQFKGQRAGWYVTAGRDVAFRWVSWSTEAAGTGPMDPVGGLAVRCFRATNISVNENQIAEIRIFPNPTTGLLKLHLPEKENQSFEVHVIDLAGKLVGKEMLSSGNLTLDLSHLNNGAYFLQILNDGSLIRSEKIVLAR